MMWLSLVVTVLVAVLLLLVEHWLPWRRILGKELPRIAAYTMGVLAMVIPLTGLVLIWDSMQLMIRGWMVAVALWIVVLASGLAVMVAYWIDFSLELHADRQAADGQRSVMAKALNTIEEGVDDQGPFVG